MFKRRKNKEKTKLASQKHTVASSVSSAPVKSPTDSDDAATFIEPQRRWTKHISRSLLNLPLASSSARLTSASARQSISPTSDVFRTFTFDLPPPRSVSYTSSPISPVAPILPAISHLTGNRSVVSSSQDGSARPSSKSSNSWLRSLGSPARKEALWEGFDQVKEFGPLDGSAPNFTATTSGAEDKHREYNEPQSSTSAEEREAQQWPLPPNVFSKLESRPVTAPHNEPNHTTGHDGKAKFMARFNANERPTSANYSRPHTSGSSHRSFVQSFDAHSTKSAAPIHTSSLSTSSITMLGPVEYDSATSPSHFSDQSHRQPPKPPGSSGSFTPFTNTNQHVIETYRPIGPVPKIQVPPPPPSISKTKNKLSLLNPVSLLLKRRSQAPIAPLSEDSLISNNTAAPYPPLSRDFDPSIRGKIVHDFSSPRESKISAFSPGYRSSSVADQETLDAQRPEKPHTPAFKEHFDEDDQNGEAAIRAEQLENADFVARNMLVTESTEAPPPPPFGRPKSSTLPLSIDTTATGGDAVQARENIPLTPVAEEAAAASSGSGLNRQSGIQRRISETRNSTSRRSAASRVSRKSLVSGTGIASDASFSRSEIPSHHNSTSSRFSFQLAGADSILQEKMLEERHKQKEAAKRLAEGNQSAQADEAEDDLDFDFNDDMDYEEDIPTIGDDWGYEESGPDVGLGNMTLDSIQEHKKSVEAIVPPLEDSFPDVPTASAPAPAVQGLGMLASPEESAGHIANVEDDPRHQLLGEPLQSSIPFNFSYEAMDDDLYFDDGMIDEVNFDETEKFDESVLDDPSHPLYERKPKEQKITTSVQVTSPADDEELDFDRSAFEANVSAFNFGSQFPHAASIEDYHSILAAATIKAAESGRFERQQDFERLQSPTVNTTREASSQPSLVQDDSHSSPVSLTSPTVDVKNDLTSNTNTTKAQDAPAVFALGSGYDTYESEYMQFASDMSDYDSAMEDDAFIAAANADALANDDDGVYGTEFGFYAKPNAGEEGAFQDGGYFGPKEWSDIKRQKSIREPNLTPITERSEYSTRNSFINLSSMDRERNQPSPGLAQLARLSPAARDGDMSMEGLMRLRKGAFGGSQASLGSLGSGRDIPSSPLISSPIATAQSARSAVFGDGQRMLFASPVITAASDIRASGEEEWEDTESAAESDYTSTEEVEDDDNDEEEGENPALSSPSPAVMAPAATMSPSTLAAPVLSAKHSGHSRSGSDTVTYVQEQDAGEAQPHWVLERRRTGNDGVEEVIGRTRIESGMI